MRIKKLLAMALLLALVCSGIFAAAPADNPQPSGLPADATASPLVENRFHDQVRPFLENYCLGCHGKEKPKGELDLSGYVSADSVANDLVHWELVLEQLAEPCRRRRRNNIPTTRRGRASSTGSRRFAKTRRQAQCRRSRPGVGAAIEQR